MLEENQQRHVSRKEKRLCLDRRASIIRLLIRDNQPEASDSAGLLKRCAFARFSGTPVEPGIVFKVR